MLDLLILGPPGAGKGTQAKRVAAELRLPHVSTGDLLREAVRGTSALGDRARAYMERGELVPDVLVDEMVASKVESPACRAGFLLDGYPRNMAQAEELDRLEQRVKRELTRVIVIDVPDSALETRLSGRRTCPAPGCGAMYHVTTNLPRTEGKCDRDGTTLIIRSDDRPEVIRERLRIYHHETEPLLAYYQKRGLVSQIDGTGSIDAITAAVVAAVGAAGAAGAAS